MNSFKPYLVPMLNSQWTDIFGNIKGISIQDISLTVDDVTFKDAKALNEKAMTFDFWSFFFLFLVTGIMLLVVFSTIVNSASMHKRKLEAVEASKAQGQHIESVRVNLAEMTKTETFFRCFSLHRNLARLFKPNRYTADDKEFEIISAVKTIAITWIVVGNAYYNVLLGPLRNLNAMHEWISSASFLWVVNADFQVDVFFWLTGFYMSYSQLKHRKNSKTEVSIWRIAFERYLRFIPIYVFMLFFLWKFISLFGGDGPRFYEFEVNHSCGDSMIWHLTMLNNLFPWGSRDYCIEPSWYLANDFQFCFICLFLASLYADNRKHYLLAFAFFLVVNLIIQIV